MGDAEITASSWRHVEVGRIVVFGSGPYEGRPAAIVEIIDHKRILVDGPNDDAAKVVPRHSAPLSNVSLLPIVISKLPRAIGNGPLKAKWKEAEVDKKFETTGFAKGRTQRLKRRQLNDFERFKVMRLRKQVKFEQRKALAKIKAAAS